MCDCSAAGSDTAPKRAFSPLPAGRRAKGRVSGRAAWQAIDKVRDRAFYGKLIDITRAFEHLTGVAYEQLTDAQILAELADRLDYLRRAKGYTDQQVVERGGISLRTGVAFRKSHKDITLTSFIKLLRGVGELGRLEQLLPPAEPSYSPAAQGFVEPPKRVRRKQPANRREGFRWGDES